MAGLLGMNEPDPLTLGLLGFSQAISTPRSRGGGVAAALGAFPMGQMQAAEMQRARQQDAMRQQLMQAQIGNYQAEADMRKRRAEQEAATAAAIRQATQGAMVTTPGSLGGGVAPTSEQGRMLLEQFGDDPQFAMQGLPGLNAALNTVGPQQPVQAPGVRFDQQAYARNLELAGFPQQAAEYRKTIGGDAAPIDKVDPAKYTPQSVARFAQTRNFNDLVPVAKEASPSDLARYRAELAALPPGHPDRRLYEQRIDLLTTRAPAPSTNVTINSGQPGFNNERALRSEFSGSDTSKAFTEVRGAYDIIKGALASPSGANDLAAATKFMKLLDPGSVVRESELGMAMAATGLLDRMQNYVQMMASGQKLTPQQRKDFASAAERIYDAARQRYASSARDIRRQANKWQLDADAVAPPAWKVYDYKSRDDAIKDARNAILRNPESKGEVIRRLEEVLDIPDHGIK